MQREIPPSSSPSTAPSASNLASFLGQLTWPPFSATPVGSIFNYTNFCAVHLSVLNADPAIKQSIDCTVRKQLGYIIGDTGRSFVVGYGTNPPARPHHRASSCPPIGVQCTWDYYNNPGPNPHTLYGAVVGGPGASDDYNDDRNDYIKNEVATDYNAGFTGETFGSC